MAAVTTTPPASAGSMPRRDNPMGIKAPTAAPLTRFTLKAKAKIPPRAQL